MYANGGRRLVFGFLVVCFGLEVTCRSREFYAGSKCRTPDHPGTCVAITNCSSALESVKEHGFHSYERCGFDRFMEIVCCPDSELRHSKPPPPIDTNGGLGEDPTEVRSPQVLRKSQKQCDKYAKKFPIDLSFHIVNGEDTEIGEFPHMAALAFYHKDDKNYQFDCGGTLISDYCVLTAAHCIVNTQEEEVKFVRLGVIDVPSSVDEPDSKLDYEVVNVTVHKDYNWKQKLNDIAVLRLGRKVVFSNSTRPACLYTKDDDPERLMVTGWGATALGGERSIILQKALLTSVSLKECNETYQTRTNRILTRSQLCAADNSRENSSDACQGDSGGPLNTLTSKSLMSVAGVTSYGIGCGSKYPGVYTRISSYLNWIEDIVWP